MKRYVFRRTVDGIHIIHLGKAWEKIQVAARRLEETEAVFWFLDVFGLFFWFLVCFFFFCFWFLVCFFFFLVFGLFFFLFLFFSLWIQLPSQKVFNLQKTPRSWLVLGFYGGPP